MLEDGSGVQNPGSPDNWPNIYPKRGEVNLRSDSGKVGKKRREHTTQLSEAKGGGGDGCYVKGWRRKRQQAKKSNSAFGGPLPIQSSGRGHRGGEKMTGLRKSEGSPSTL